MLGGGIAGLLLASELAGSCRLLLLEKQKAVGSPKYWLTDDGSKALHPDLWPALDRSYGYLDFVACDWTTYRCHGTYWLWDTNKLTNLLLQRIRERGGTIITGSTFYSLGESPRSVDVFFDKQAAVARLVVDCLGSASSIVHAKRLMTIYGYYVLFGGTFPMARWTDPIALHNLAIGARPVYVEALPTAAGAIHLALIVPERSARPTTVLKDGFHFLIHNSPYADLIQGQPTEARYLGGIVPVGRLRTSALDRLLFFGEAGQHNPAASATMLTRVLYRYKPFAAFITDHLRSDSLSARELSSFHPPFIDRFNRSVQEALFLEILDWSSEDFKAIIGDLVRHGEDAFVFDLMFGNLPASKAQLARRLLRLRSERAHSLFWTLWRGGLRHLGLKRTV